MKKLIEQAEKEFDERYDFSESKTLEYNNLIGIKQFLSDYITKAYEIGKEEKLSSTYKSSQMYLMGFMDGKDEEKGKLLTELEDEIEKLRVVPKDYPDCDCGRPRACNCFNEAVAGNEMIEDILEIINKLKR